jgi:VWFA-related protein
MTIRRKAFFLSLLAVLFARVYAQEETIKVNTTLVSVPVIVSDRQGRYVPSLTAADFSLQRDGKNQKIDFFASTEEPINVAVLIDTSQSTRPVLDDIKKAAERFVKLLGPKDKASVVSFDYETHVLSPLTGNAEQLRRAIREAEIPDYVGTTLRDAVYQTVKDEFRGVSGRKAIILLTDGKDAGSQVTSPDLLYSLQESDVMIYPIYFETGNFRQRFDRPMDQRGDIFGGRFPGRAGRFPRGGGRFPGNDPFPGGNRVPERRRERVEEKNELAQEFLEKLSDATAGRFYSSESSKFKDTFELIVDELRHQYRLGFYPPEEETADVVHYLHVRVSRPDLSVRARANYRALPK